MKARTRSSLVAVGLIFLATWLVPNAGASATKSKHSEGVTFRAVLCFAPLRGKLPFSPRAALPECRSAFRLTAKNLGVHPNNSAQGFTMKNEVLPDPRFLRFPDSSSATHSLTSDLLLSKINGAVQERFVVGPARLTSSSIKSAKAVKQSGQWVVTYQLTKSGTKAWNAFLKRNFHAFIAIVANGQVYSAPLIQPSQTHFTPFNSSGEVSGTFDKAQAKYLARQMVTKNS